jgi:hypothetical protein
MAENYKHLYEQTKKMLTMYQDELIPGFRKKIEELEAKVATDNNVGNKWIPVTERLPETRGFTDCCCGETLEYEMSADYLCFTEDNEYHVCCLVRSDGLEYWDEWDGGTHTVTHWMPLPEPPKEVE